jgi:hypothetical protein
MGSKAINNQWVIAYHRLTYAKEHNRPCRCEDCREHLAAMKDERGINPTLNRTVRGGGEMPR